MLLKVLMFFLKIKSVKEQKNLVCIISNFKIVD